jgi:hypothetical protein
VKGVGRSAAAKEPLARLEEETADADRAGAVVKPSLGEEQAKEARPAERRRRRDQRTRQTEASSCETSSGDGHAAVTERKFTAKLSIPWRRRRNA